MKQELTLKIGGKRRLLKFGTNQTAIYCDKYDLSLVGYTESLSNDKVKPGNLRDLIWSALVAGAQYKGQEVDFDELKVGDWIDDLSQSDLDSVFNVLSPNEGESEPGNL
jgi:hypothetical protein